MRLVRKSLSSSIQLLQVDFSKPWWYIVWQQKALVALVGSTLMVYYAFYSLSPLIIAYIVTHASFSAYIVGLLAFLTVEGLYIGIVRNFNAEFQLLCIHSIYQSVHQYILTVDPRYHIYRSSGAILGKIERGTRGYEDFLDQVTFDFMPLSVGVVTTLCVLSTYSFLLVGLVSVIFIIMLIIGYYAAGSVYSEWEQKFIVTDDAYKSVAAENLAQVHLVRSTFSSDFMSDKLTKKIYANMHTEASVWFSYSNINSVLTLLYITGLFGVIAFLMWHIKQGSVSVSVALGTIAAYVQSTKEMVKVVRPLRRCMRSLTAIRDLFAAVVKFGAQHYPVLGKTQNCLVSTDTLSLRVSHMSFNYERAQLFNKHSLTIVCSLDQPTKLYGIIGPSGSGKTTLLSILGGQIKPEEGNVYVNGIDIYKVPDSVRRQLIALQGQIATGVKGTIRYNLLFGLPEDHGYDDACLLKLLERVGLSVLITEYEGLNTFLGEGGLNISGGQRQRLNFAGLYLRACYFKPALILIDEPTSSLDEVSEEAITQMILELAQYSIVLVIAHRLKTLKSAQGLIDLSLLDVEHDIKIYNPLVLKEHSAYYRRLLINTEN